MTHCLRTANSQVDPATRMNALAAAKLTCSVRCPWYPCFSTDLQVFRSPMCGVEHEPARQHPFKYVWIDTNWRPVMKVNESHGERYVRRAFSRQVAAAAGAYFGRNDPPTEQRLIYIIGSEPRHFDPCEGLPGGRSI